MFEIVTAKGNVVFRSHTCKFMTMSAPRAASLSSRPPPPPKKLAKGSPPPKKDSKGSPPPPKPPSFCKASSPPRSYLIILDKMVTITKHSYISSTPSQLTFFACPHPKASRTRLPGLGTSCWLRGRPGFGLGASLWPACGTPS